jgi:hypothetical protein
MKISMFAFGAKKYIYLLPILGILLIAAGCSKTTQKNEEKTTDKTQTEEMMKEEVKNPMMNNSEQAHGAKLAGTRIEIQNINNLKPGEVTLSFKLYGLDAHEFGPNDLKITHEKLMHLMLVRDDMQYYQHLHPEFVQDKWTIKTQIPEQGNYEMYVDVSPKEEKATVLRVPLIIGGATKEKKFPIVTKDLTAITDGITASLDKLELEKKTAEVKLKFRLTKNGQAITQIQPYLGAFGHVVALKHDQPDHFVHAHPLNETAPQNGIVDFEIELQEKGMYTIYAQFNINGQIKTFPITLEVKSATTNETIKSDQHMQ